MVDSVKPDIIVGTESWLRPDIMNSEIFPSNYTVYRRDRDTSGGGVFIAVIDEKSSTRQRQDSVDLLFSSLDRICNSKNCHI